MKYRYYRFSVAFYVMETDYVKVYKFILEDEKIDLRESMLLCLYLQKYFYHNGNVITSDTKDSKYIDIDRKYVGKHRKHLEELGYIKCFVNKGKSVSIQLHKDIVDKAIEVNKKVNKNK